MDILVRSDTLRIFRSGTDAAGLNRSDEGDVPATSLLKIVIPDTRREQK